MPTAPRRTLLSALVAVTAATGCQHTSEPLADVLAAEPAAPLARELSAAPGRIWLAGESSAGDVRVYSMSPATLAPVLESPGDAAYLPAPGPLPLAIAVEDDGAGGVHREQLALRGADGAWQRLGPVAGAIRNPSVAPDGDWIVFESDASSFRDLYRLDVATGLTTRLTRDGDGAFDPDVSPTGRRIAFVSTASGDAELHAIDPDGRNRALLVDAPGMEQTPRWSPDGTAIAFEGDRDGPERLFILDMRTGETRRATALDRDDRHESDPVWSPDGSKLAYLVHFATGQRELWVVARGGGEPVRVSAPAAGVVSASWSPDGRYLAYDEHTPDGRRVEIARADGTARMRVATGPAGGRLPRWR